MKTLDSIPNRTYKATIFAMLFEDKEHLLELYNAISGKHYTNPEMLEINTLENAISIRAPVYIQSQFTPSISALYFRTIFVYDERR